MATQEKEKPMTEKPMRRFVVIGDSAAGEEHGDKEGEFGVYVCDAKTPREAALMTFNSDTETSIASSLEVFEMGRGRRYVSQRTAVPAGKAE